MGTSPTSIASNKSNLLDVAAKLDEDLIHMYRVLSASKRRVWIDNVEEPNIAADGQGTTPLPRNRSNVMPDVTDDLFNGDGYDVEDGDNSEDNENKLDS